jgi:hypothetical protein
VYDSVRLFSTKSYDILNASGRTAQTVTFPFRLYKPDQHDGDSTASGLLLEALRRLENQPFGFEQERRIVASIDLEPDSQRQLHQTRVVRLTAHDPELRGTEDLTRKAELRSVEQVEKFGPELE